MTQELRRAERIIVNFTVSVHLVDEKTGAVLAGPVDGEARNFSPMGLALALPNIIVGKYHLFFTCQDNLSHILKIGIKLPADPDTRLEVPAKPVWYDRDKRAKAEKRALLGVEFQIEPKDKVIQKLCKELSTGGETPQSWWQKKIF